MIKIMVLLCLSLGLNLWGCGKPDAQENRQSKISSARYKASPKKTRGTNTQQKMPLNLSIADMDADGIGDFLQFAGNTLFAKKTNFEKTDILKSRLMSPIVQLYSGDFLGDGYDQTCALLSNNSLHCYGISTERKQLWKLFTQPNFISTEEDAIVADYDGDTRDDILLYNRNSGQFRMFSLKAERFFKPVENFDPGNLTGTQPGMQIRAVTNYPGRAGIVVVNPHGQILLYGSVNYNGTNTFWWAFTTRGGFVGQGEDVTLAKVNADAQDDVVIHNIFSGQTRFHELAYSEGELPVLQGFTPGQISVQPNTYLYWSYVRGPYVEPGSDVREDAMVFDFHSNMFIRSDARWDGSQYTFWWAYTQHAPTSSEN